MFYAAHQYQESTMITSAEGEAHEELRIIMVLSWYSTGGIKTEGNERSLHEVLWENLKHHLLT